MKSYFYQLEEAYDLSSRQVPKTFATNIHETRRDTRR